MVSSAAGMAGKALGGKVTSALGSTGLGSFINALLRTDPEAPYHFSIEIDGVIAGRCKEVDKRTRRHHCSPALEWCAGRRAAMSCKANHHVPPLPARNLHVTERPTNVTMCLLLPARNPRSSEIHGPMFISRWGVKHLEFWLDVT